MMGGFHYLNALSGISADICRRKDVPHRVVQISIGASLFIVVVLLTGSIVASLIRPLIERLQFIFHTGRRRHPWDDSPAEFKP